MKRPTAVSENGILATGMLHFVDASASPTYRLTACPERSRRGLGSTAARANSGGTVTDTCTGACPERSRRDAFGAVRSHSGSNGTEFTFTGEQNDPNGLEYLRARYYDPATGRFLGRDPLGGGYPYAGSNPANMVDPTGLCDLAPWEWYDCAEDAVSWGVGAASDVGQAFAEAVDWVADGAANGANETADALASAAYIGLDFVEAGGYAVYYASYQAQDLIDEAGPVVVQIAPIEPFLIALQVFGLGIDMGVDYIQGEGIYDEGLNDSIWPDPVQSALCTTRTRAMTVLGACPR